MPNVSISMPDLPSEFGYSGEYRETKPMEWLLLDTRPHLAVPDGRTGRPKYGHCIILNGPGDGYKLKWLKAQKALYIADCRRDGRVPKQWLADLVAAIEALEGSPVNA